MADFEVRRETLEWTSECAQLYHGKRRAFLDKAAKLDPILSLVCGSAAFGTAVADVLWLTAAASLIITVYSAANISFGFSLCAEKHQELLKKWGELRRKLLALDAADSGGLLALEKEAEMIHEESPEQLILLSALCEDQVRLARGQAALINPPQIMRYLANFFSLGWEKYQVNPGGH
jgi:hypothetical protein